MLRAIASVASASSVSPRTCLNGKGLLINGCRMVATKSSLRTSIAATTTSRGRAASSKVLTTGDVQKIAWGLQYVENEVASGRVVPAKQPVGRHTFALSNSDPQAMVR